jgi:hypothetical protein
MDIGFLYPVAPDTAPDALLRDVLDSFRGISFVLSRMGNLS